MLTKGDKIKNLYDKYKQEFSKEKIVLGVGNLDTDIILVGEAPGKDEVRLSKPFAGVAGKNLDEFLNILNIDRSSIYITNAIKYRLSKVNPKTGRVINRPATKLDIESSREYLKGEIEIIKPKYVVTLGNVPLRAVTGDYAANIGMMHGKVYTINKEVNFVFYLYPLYHPASIIYNRSLKPTYLEDVLRLKSVLHDAGSKEM